MNSTLPPVDEKEHHEAFIHSGVAIAIAFCCAFFALVVSLYNIFKHLVTYSSPHLQKNIIRILFIVPFYAVFSFASLVFPHAHLYLDAIRDIWEAFVVYCFLALMLEFCGGENNCLSVIMNHPGAISHMYPFSVCAPEIPLDATFMRTAKRLTLQFVVVKPVMAVLNLIMLSADLYEDETFRVLSNIIYNVSYTAALYALFLFYIATREHPGLTNKHPVLKFLSVKTIVFATYYQSLAVSVIPGISDEELNMWNSFILCCEMVLFAVLHLVAFNSSEFSSGINTSTMNKGNRDIAMRNARDVVSIRDVAKDAYYNFNSKYGSHVMLECDMEYIIDEEPTSGRRTSTTSDTTGIDLIELGHTTSNNGRSDNPLASPMGAEQQDSKAKEPTPTNKKSFRAKSYLIGNIKDFSNSYNPFDGGGTSPRDRDNSFDFDQKRIEGFGDLSALNKSNYSSPKVFRYSSAENANSTTNLDSLNLNSNNHDNVNTTDTLTNA